MVKFRLLRRESNCFVMFSAGQNDCKMSQMSCDLSTGRDAFMSMESSVMPRNLRRGSGPIVFSSDRDAEGTGTLFQF